MLLRLFLVGRAGRVEPLRDPDQPRHEPNGKPDVHDRGRDEHPESARVTPLETEKGFGTGLRSMLEKKAGGGSEPAQEAAPEQPKEPWEVDVTAEMNRLLGRASIAPPPSLLRPRS